MKHLTTRAVGPILLALVAALFCATTVASAEQRLALVIGNSAYERATRLPNTANDASDITASLQRLGFKVELQRDLSLTAMRRALHEFGRRARGADMALIYFAGHGIEVGKRNYLIPTDARLRSNFDVDFEAISLDLVLAAVGNAKGLRLVLLDACRNNPFVSSMALASRSRAIGRGFSRVEPTAGTLVGYAAREGTTADDGEGRNSPYARALLAHLEEPGLEVSLLFRKVRDFVLKETGGAQEPFVYGSLPGKRIYLKASAVPQTVTSDAERNELRERGAWNFVRQSRNPMMLRDYVARFPNGRFRHEAKALIEELETSALALKANPGQTASGRGDGVNGDSAAKRLQRDEIRLLSERLEAEARRKISEAHARAEARRKIEHAQALADWRKVRTSTNIAELEAYVARHPSSLFTNLAMERLTALRNQKVAALQPPASEAPDSANNSVGVGQLDNRQLAFRLQQELNRVGCDAGRPDGKWGKGSRRALQGFARNAGLHLASLSPSQDVLDTVSRQKARVCPLDCGPRQVEKGNRCVPKTCGRGKELNRKGVCVARLDDQSRKKKLNCSPRHRLKGNRCVLKTCGRGKELDRRGRCVAKRPDNDKKNGQTAKRNNRQKSRSGKKCGLIVHQKSTVHMNCVNKTRVTRACGAAYERAKRRGLACG